MSCFAENEKEKFNPKSREIAVCYQLHDDLRVAYSLAQLSKTEFERGLMKIQTTIAAYFEMEIPNEK